MTANQVWRNHRTSRRHAERTPDGLKSLSRSSDAAWANPGQAAVSRAGFYAWFGRPPSERTIEDGRLAVLMHAAHERSRKTYGSPRLHAELQAGGTFVGRKRVIRIMQGEGIRGRVRRRYKCTTMSNHDQPVAANILDRKFDPAEPNKSWVGDVTELITQDGRLYLAIVLDLFSRFVVGWALSAVNDRHLAIKALDMALRRRCPEVGPLHHTDQGSRTPARTTRRFSTLLASPAV